MANTESVPAQAASAMPEASGVPEASAIPEGDVEGVLDDLPLQFLERLRMLALIARGRIHLRSNVVTSSVCVPR